MHVTGTVPPPAPAPQDIHGGPAHPGDTPDGGGRRTRRFGLPVATALVMGNIIGGGIFLLPASIAPYGTISLLAFGVLTVGAIALALVFGRLAERDPAPAARTCTPVRPSATSPGSSPPGRTGSPPGCRTRRSPWPPSVTSTY